MSFPISEWWTKYKSLGIPPWLEALALGGATFVGGKLLWHPVANTVMSLAKAPAKAMGVSPEEMAEVEDRLHNDPKYKTYIPAAMAALVASGHLGFSARGNERYYGLLQHDAPVRPTMGDKKHTWKQNAPDGSMDVTASFDDMSSGFTLFNDMDTGRRIDGDRANDLFRDPMMTPYARNMGTAIVNNAMNNSGVGNPTLGNIFDSAADKFRKKLTFGGLAEIGVKTVIANSMANLFASALGTMTGISPATQDKIVQAGTWAGAINAIMN